MKMREFIGLVIAGTADAVQLGTTVVSLGSDQITIPAQILFSAVVSILLALVMGPQKKFLPTFVLEVLPFVNVLPSFTGAAILAIKEDRKKQDPEPKG